MAETRVPYVPEFLRRVSGCYVCSDRIPAVLDPAKLTLPSPALYRDNARAMTTTPYEPNPKIRWFQIGLRLALIVAICWIGLRLQRARANRDRVAAVAKTVATVEDLNDQVEGRYEEIRPQTWVEELFDDPGGADDPVGAVKITPLAQWSQTAQRLVKEKAHLHNKAVINAAVERYYVNIGKWPSSDLNEMLPPTTYDYFPDGFPANPIDVRVYTIDETTHRVP